MVKGEGKRNRNRKGNASASTIKPQKMLTLTDVLLADASSSPKEKNSSMRSLRLARSRTTDFQSVNEGSNPSESIYPNTFSLLHFWKSFTDKPIISSLDSFEAIEKYLDNRVKLYNYSIVGGESVEIHFEGMLTGEIFGKEDLGKYNLLSVQTVYQNEPQIIKFAVPRQIKTDDSLEISFGYNIGIEKVIPYIRGIITVTE